MTSKFTLQISHLLTSINDIGNQPYVKKNGEDIAVLNAVEAITYCLQSKDCTDIPFQL